MHNKLDKQGNFTYFPGITIVSAILDEDLDLWGEVRDQLEQNSKVRQYVALLPARSYHVTSIRITTENEMALQGVDWHNHLTKNESYYQSLCKKLENEIISSVKFKIQGVEVNGVIQLLMEPSSEFKAGIERLAQDYHISFGLPGSFHMTLGYLKQPILEEESKKQIEETLYAIIKKIPPEIRLTPPRLCYFNDMTKFIPWDGGPISRMGSNGTFFNKINLRSQSTTSDDIEQECDDEIVSLEP